MKKPEANDENKIKLHNYLIPEPEMSQEELTKKKQIKK